MALHYSQMEVEVLIPCLASTDTWVRNASLLWLERSGNFSFLSGFCYYHLARKAGVPYYCFTHDLPSSTGSNRDGDGLTAIRQ